MEITEITGPMFAAHKLIEELEEAADMRGADLRFEHQGPVDAGECFITVVVNGEDEYIHNNTDAIFAYLAGLEKGAYLSTHSTETKIPGSANWKIASPEDVVEQICEIEKKIKEGKIKVVDVLIDKISRAVDNKIDEARGINTRAVDEKKEKRWIDWNGGDMPTDAESIVEMIQRDGTPEIGRAKDFRWSHAAMSTTLVNPNFDIVKYRVIEK